MLFLKPSNVAMDLLVGWLVGRSFGLSDSDLVNGVIEWLVD